MIREKQEVLKSAQVEQTGERTLRFVASKQVRDRDNDLVYSGPNEKGKGILTDEFQKNPVFLKIHDDRSWPIGKVTEYKLGTDPAGVPQFEITVEFADTEDGNKALYLYKNGFMNAVSIRFRMLDYLFNEQAQGFDIYTSKLWEVSAVPLPANQEALLMKAYTTEQELTDNEHEKITLSEEAEKRLDIIRENLRSAGLTDKAGRMTESIYSELLKLKK